MKNFASDVGHPTSIAWSAFSAFQTMGQGEGRKLAGREGTGERNVIKRIDNDLPLLLQSNKVATFPRVRQRYSYCGFSRYCDSLLGIFRGGCGFVRSVLCPRDHHVFFEVVSKLGSGRERSKLSGG